MVVSLIFSLACLSGLDLCEFRQYTTAEKPHSYGNANDIDHDGNHQTLFHPSTSNWWNQVDIHRPIGNANAGESGSILD